MVRQAMQGVKVHEVDGVKFDLYSMGAVLFSMIENSFPAHGNLSQINKRCPEALRWVVRRAMADTRNRYVSAREMLADVATLLEASDPFAVKPADLPSFGKDPSLANRIDPDRYRGIPTAGLGPLPLDPPSVPSYPRTARRPRRRIHGGVLAAVALFGLMLLAGSGLTASQLRRARHMVPDATAQAHSHVLDHVDTVIERAVQTLDRGRGVAMDTSTGSDCYRHGDHIHHAEDCSGSHTEQVGSPAQLATSLTTPFDVLVVSDLPPSAGDVQLRTVAEALDRADMQPRGLAADDERETEWLAEARRAAGVGFPESPEAVARLEEYLRSNEVLDAIWWVREGDRDGDLISRFVTRDGLADDSVASVLLKAEVR
jgi:hypothetical protein